jgi:hypothetical protein
MAKKHTATHWGVRLLWSANLLGLLALLLYLQMEKPFRAQPQLAAAQPALTATETPFSPQTTPTRYLLPSTTPNPHATRMIATTPTPVTLHTETANPAALVIGYSVLGRPLEVYQFGHGETERLIIAGIHGGYEWNTIALADELIAELNTHPELVPEQVTLYILRALNPDGEARAHGRDGRANEHGVDLNHNFPYHWKEDWNREDCWNYLPLTAGAYPASEPETIALMNFIEQHHFDALISYHSAALGIFAGGMPPYKPSEELAQKIANVSPYLYPPQASACEYSGNLTDWASSVKKIAAIDIELNNHQDTDFGANLRILTVFLNWTP